MCDLNLESTETHHFSPQEPAHKGQTLKPGSDPERVLTHLSFPSTRSWAAYVFVP